MKNLDVGKTYKLQKKDVKYLGIGKNTSEYMFRDKISGQIIFVDRRDLLFVTER